MSVAHFTFTGSNELSAQPSTEKLVVVSTNAADTTQTMTLAGTIGGVGTSEGVALSGVREKTTSGTFTALASASLSATALGTVRVRGSGTAAVGYVLFGSVPADGDTLTLGLTGYTTVYTFRSPGRHTILCLAAASIGQGDYFDYTWQGTINRFWFDKDAAGTGAPSNPGNSTEVDIVTGDTDAQVATKLQTALDLIFDGDPFVEISTNTLTITGVSLGAVTVADGAGGAATGFTFTTINAGTASAASQIRTLWDIDGTAATTTDVAEWTDLALTATTGEAEYFSTGTVAHVDLGATFSGNVLTLTDNVAALRSLAWACAETGTSMTVGNPVGGTNGTLLATLTTGQTSAFDTFELDTEDLAADTLPALFTGNSDWVAVEAACALQFKCENVTSGITAKYQTSVDQTNASDGVTTVTTIDNNPVLTPLRINCAEAKISSIRLVITANTNTTGSALSAAVIY